MFIDFERLYTRVHRCSHKSTPTTTTTTRTTRTNKHVLRVQIKQHNSITIVSGVHLCWTTVHQRSSMFDEKARQHNGAHCFSVIANDICSKKTQRCLTCQISRTRNCDMGSSKTWILGTAGEPADPPDQAYPTDPRHGGATGARPPRRLAREVRMTVVLNKLHQIKFLLKPQFLQP